MTTLLPQRPSLALSTLSGRTRIPLRRTTRFGLPNHRPALRSSLVVAARLGFGPDPFPDPEFLTDLYGRAEGILYTLADAAVSAPAAPEVVATVKSDDWFSGIANYMESVLKVLKDGLSAVHVPYSYGFAIILLTILVKAATFPLTKKQVESAMAMRSLQPQIKAIQQRFAGDQERIQLETARLYKVVGVNPLAGCLPTLATIPVWIGLYRALSNVADEGLLTEGFFWIPSLSGPTTVAARQSGSGVSWLFPFVDGHPPLGWSDTLAYLVLPVLLVVSQYISVQVMQSTQNTDPKQKSPPLVTKFLPLLIGYFSLSVPSGLSLYWLTNNILSTTQQVWLQKNGGAKIPASQITTDVAIEDNVEVQKAVLDVPLTPKSSQKREKLTTEGPRPGERFRQLKEEEARRKRQLEEEKRRAEEAIANGTRVTNGKSNEAGVDFGNEHRSENSIHSSSDSGPNGNGNLSSQQPQENLRKEEVETYTVSTTRDKIPSEDE